MTSSKAMAVLDELDVAVVWRNRSFLPRGPNEIGFILIISEKLEIRVFECSPLQ